MSRGLSKREAKGQQLAMATARKFVLAAHFQGAPKRSDLKIVEEKLPTLNDGGESL